MGKAGLNLKQVPKKVHTPRTLELLASDEIAVLILLLYLGGWSEPRFIPPNRAWRLIEISRNIGEQGFQQELLVSLPVFDPRLEPLFNLSIEPIYS